MSEEVDDGIKRKPAKYNPWQRFLVKSLELDGKKYPKGWHWFWGIYGLHKDKHELLRINLEKIQKNIPQDHWLNQLNRRDESSINVITSKDRATSVLYKFLQEYDNLETSYKINFSVLIFEPDEIDFSNLVFPLKTSFEYSDVSFNSKFTNTYFCENANFNNAILSGDPDFEDATFLTTAIFDKVKFKGRPLFINTKFSDFITFNDADFSNVAFFRNATFSRPAFFNKAKFSEYADFTDVTFLYPVEFYETKFSTEALFNSAKFRKGAFFNKTIFSKSADFTDAVFSQIAEFESAIFSDNACFNNATFRGHTNFIGTHFKNHLPHFYNATLTADITWRNAIWPSINIKTDKNQSAYENLAYHMKTLDKYHDQHFFFRQEMRCRQYLEQNSFIGLAYKLYEDFADYGYGIDRAFKAWVWHMLYGVGAIIVMIIISVVIHALLGYWQGWLNLIENLFCAFPVSVTNANPVAFIGADSFGLMDCYDSLKKLNPLSFGIIRVIQTVIGIALLSLLIITLRIRFSLK